MKICECPVCIGPAGTGKTAVIQELDYQARIAKLRTDFIAYMRSPQLGLEIEDEEPRHASRPNA